MRISEIKQELDERGIGYVGLLEKPEFVDLLADARARDTRKEVETTPDTISASLIFVAALLGGLCSIMSTIMWHIMWHKRKTSKSTGRKRVQTRQTTRRQEARAEEAKRQEDVSKAKVADRIRGEVADRIRGEVCMIAACMEHEIAGGASRSASTSYGTNAFIKAMATGSWEELLNEMHRIIRSHAREREKPPHVPVLSMSWRFELRDRVCFKNSLDGGRTRSLLIGIKYAREKSPLKGISTDVKEMKTFLKTQGYSMKDEHCQSLLDSGARVKDKYQWQQGYPGKQGILDGFEWLVKGAKDGDSLFFFFSGHGTQITQENAHGEVIVLDEAIVPVDHRYSGMITGADILANLILKVPKGVRLTAVMDCCFSGNIFKLPYKISAGEKIVHPNQRFNRAMKNLQASSSSKPSIVAHRERSRVRTESDRSLREATCPASVSVKEIFQASSSSKPQKAASTESEAEFARRVSEATAKLRAQLRSPSENPFQASSSSKLSMTVITESEAEFARRVSEATVKLRAQVRSPSEVRPRRSRHSLKALFELKPGMNVPEMSDMADSLRTSFRVVYIV